MMRDGVCLNCNLPSFIRNSFNNPSNVLENFSTLPPTPLTCCSCGNVMQNGSCMFCGSNNSFSYDQNPNSFNYPPQPNYPSYEPRYCCNCGDFLDSSSCCNRCTCERCGRNIINGFCSTCAFEANNSYTNDFNPNFSDYPQNDFNFPPQNSYEQEPCFNNSFQITPNFDDCGGSFANFHNEPNACYYSQGFNQPPQNLPNLEEMRKILEEIVIRQQRADQLLLAELNTSTPEPRRKSKEELLAIEKAKNPPISFCDCSDCCPPHGYFTYSIVEPDGSLTMGIGPRITIPVTESDEFQKSSVESLVPIQSESGENSTDEKDSVVDITPVDEEKILVELLAKEIRELCVENNEEAVFDSFLNSTPSSDPLLSDSSIPSLTLDERNDVFLDEIEEYLANDSIPTTVDESTFDPEGDIHFLESLLNEESLSPTPPVFNEEFDDADETPNDDDVESYTDSHNEYEEDSCGDIDDVEEIPFEFNSLDDDDEDDNEIKDPVLREKLSNVYLLISKIEALCDPPTSSPIPVMDSDFLPELEVFRFEETNSGNPTNDADISFSDYERFHFEINSELISDNPSFEPLLATDDSIPLGVEND